MPPEKLRLAILRALQGAFLSVGAPFGWMLLQWLSGENPLRELLLAPGVYAYMLFGTMLVFGAFGYYAGKREEDFRNLALNDGLTGLPNTRYFWRAFREAHASAQRNHLSLSIVVMDIDHFKLVNDRYGHDVGDAVLSAVGHALLSIRREGEMPARIGGEEFAVILPAVSAEDAAKAAARFRASMAEAFVRLPSGETLKVTLSAGVACDKNGETMGSAEQLFKAADTAMYAAKRQGRDQVQMA